MPVGAPLTVTDPDSRRFVWMPIRGDGHDWNYFEIDRDTGQLLTRFSLDPERRDKYELMVRVQDYLGALDSIRVFVSVFNAPPPVQESTPPESTVTSEPTPMVELTGTPAPTGTPRPTNTPRPPKTPETMLTVEPTSTPRPVPMATAAHVDDDSGSGNSQIWIVGLLVIWIIVLIGALTVANIRDRRRANR